MLTVGEWLDEVDEITETLVKRSEEICREEIKRANAHQNGYRQACKDFKILMRSKISQNQG